MGSRLRPSPEKIFECFLEVTAPIPTDGGPEIKFIHPTDFDEKEALKAIPQFCYPCVTNSEAVQHYTFVLTDIEGKYRFGFCRYSPDVKTCLCILSYLPWFKIFYELLNRISDLKRTKEDNAFLPLLNYLLTQSPPKPGSPLAVKVNEESKEFSFVVPDVSKLPSIPEDRNLTDYYAAVDPSNMILIFASMFFERRIIVTSKKLNLLTACTYGAASLLYPMHWQHMFVPIVPPHLLDYCCAPMPFLVGVHSSLMPKVRQMPLDEVVIVDADTNVVESPFDDISQLPADAVSTLKSTLKKPVYPIDDNISRAFLCAMVSLIGGYRDALRLKPGEKIFFDRDVFVQSRSNSMRQLLEFILQLQLFEQFITERLDMLNAGRGFNDAFEEQIGLQAENRGSWKTQYQLWMKETMKSGGAFLDKTEEKMKKRYKEAKHNWKHVKSGIKSQLADVKGGLVDKLKGKEDDDSGGEQKRAHTNPEAVKPFSVRKLSPFSKRRTISPGEFERVKIEPGSKVPPPRPPPPRLFPYASDRRPRTSALSKVEGRSSPKMITRRSVPSLVANVAVGELISLDDSTDSSDVNADSVLCATDPKSNEPDVDLKQVDRTAASDDSSEVFTPSGTINNQEPDFTLRRSGSDRRTSEGSEVSLERSKSSPSRPKPPVPKRPASVKKKSLGSVDALLETGSPKDDTISPLRPVSLSLLRDTVVSLPPDAQEFLFTDSEINSFNLSAGDAKTNLNSAIVTKESELLERSVTSQNHLGAVDLSRLEIRRDSGPYDNFPRIIPAQQSSDNLEIIREEKATDKQSQLCNAQQSWVSFD
ncbi:unnamed protein product [Porites lobata]|uniref:UDENN domain-containing protein n=1 Tax=Porites lobata TaxID=104759 RepID=A0ABN8Q612_9CNID|nr:unnamed protein product [Porites lobata]